MRSKEVQGGTLTEEEDVERDYGVDRSRGPKAVPLPGLPPLVLPLVRVVQPDLDHGARQATGQVQREQPPASQELANVPPPKVQSLRGGGWRRGVSARPTGMRVKVAETHQHIHRKVTKVELGEHGRQ